MCLSKTEAVCVFLCVCCQSACHFHLLPALRKVLLVKRVWPEDEGCTNNFTFMCWKITKDMHQSTGSWPESASFSLTVDWLTSVHIAGFEGYHLEQERNSYQNVVRWEVLRTEPSPRVSQNSFPTM